VILLGLLVLTSELLLPSIVHAQTSSLGPAYSFNESTLAVSDYNSGNYRTFNAALSAARAKFIADTRSPTSQCPLEVSVFTYLGQTAQARIDYSGPNDALSCYSGAGYGVTYVFASHVNYDLGKNAGDCACDGGNGHKSGPAPGTPLKGEPINIATGNKFEQDTDYVAPTSWLTFRRFYNGLVAVDPTTLGTTWRHSFDRSLKFASSVSIRAYRPDGRFEKFSKSNTGAWTPDADIADSLIQESDANGNATGYTVFVAASQQFEQYSATGLLLSIKDEAGQVMTLTYSTTSTSVSIAPAPNLLLTVTDPNGRVLQFTYDSSARLHTVTQPDSGVLTYGYDAATGDLTSVQYPDGKIRQYAYNEASLTGGANLPGVLTGVIDEAGARYASTTYDSTGRATSASLAGGVDAMTVTYGTSTGTTPTTITTALGVSTSLGFQNILGALKVAGSSQACGASCNQPWQATAYDANG
jgi:YD repeat-containing protein